MIKLPENIEKTDNIADSKANKKKWFSSHRSLAGLVRSFPIGWAGIAFLLTLLLADVASQLISPLLMQQLVDGMTRGAAVGHLVVALSVAMLGGTLFGAFLSYLVARKGSLWVRQIREAITERLLFAPVGYFDDLRSSKPASHLIKDSALIQELISHHSIGVVSGLIVVVGCVVVMWTLDLVLTLVLLGIVLGAFVVTVPVAAGLTSLSQRLQKQEAESIASLAELLGQIALVKSLSAEEALIDKQQDQIRSLFRFELREIKIQSLLGPLVSVAISAGMIAILAFGSYRVSIGAISMGKLLAFILYLFNIVIPLAQLSIFVGSLNKAAGAAEQLAEFMNAPQEPLTDGSEVDLAAAEIEFSGMSFRFDKQPILQEIDLIIPSGRMTALVGESGAGKTTLLNLLDRLYTVPSGQLLIGGRCADSFSLRHWRRQIAMVSQTAPVISGSLRENLTLGLDRKVEDTQLLTLIREFGLSDLTLDTEDLLDGGLKEQGKNLSGGQRQRIAIARALLRQPNLLLLDEATSALDALTEKKITSALAKLASNTTTVVAAHRLSTVAKADLIVVMKDGRIVDKGSHQHLLARCQYYHELVEQQMLPMG